MVRRSPPSRRVRATDQSRRAARFPAIPSGMSCEDPRCAGVRLRSRRLRNSRLPRLHSRWHGFASPYHSSHTLDAELPRRYVLLFHAANCERRAILTQFLSHISLALPLCVRADCQFVAILPLDAVHVNFSTRAAFGTISNIDWPVFKSEWKPSVNGVFEAEDFHGQNARGSSESASAVGASETSPASKGWETKERKS